MPLKKKFWLWLHLPGVNVSKSVWSKMLLNAHIQQILGKYINCSEKMTAILSEGDAAVDCFRSWRGLNIFNSCWKEFILHWCICRCARPPECRGGNCQMNWCCLMWQMWRHISLPVSFDTCRHHNDGNAFVIPLQSIPSPRGRHKVSQAQSCGFYALLKM